MNPISVTSYSTDAIEFTRSIDFDVANEAAIVIIFWIKHGGLRLIVKRPVTGLSDKDWSEIMPKWE